MTTSSPSPSSTSPESGWGARRALVAVLLGFLAFFLFAAAALGVALYQWNNEDPYLEVTASSDSVKAGEPVTGKVARPTGEITVTLYKLDEGEGGDGVDQNVNDPNTTMCEYDSGQRTFTCPTTDLAPGPYMVQLTDTEYPSEGTKIARVRITSN